MGRLTSLPSAVVTDDSALGGAVIANSLRVSTTDSSYLIRTPSSAGNRRTFTISLWVKRSSMSGSAVFGAYISSSDRATLRFASGDVIEFQTSGYSVKTDAAFRDTNSWYHIVCAIDTTQGTQSDRGKIYVNGVQQSLQSNNLTQNLDTSVNNNSVQTFGTRWIGGYNGGFDGYLAEINLIDGFQLDPTYFGYTEFQTGIWRPKGYFGSYGTNGVRLDFSDNSATTAVTLGKDRSGQGNDYTPTNLSVSAGVGNDSFLESPTAKKEFPTFNSNLQLSSSTEYRQGNLAFYTSGSSTVQTRANMSRNSGKWYAEFTLTTYTHRSGSYPYLGVASAENFANTWTGDSGTAYQSQGGIWRNSSNIESGYATYAAGDVISVAINLDSSPPQVWWAKNGSYIRSGANPSTLTAGVNIEPASPTGTYTFTASLYANPGQWDANFGQRAFAHSIPTGFKSLNTDNFPINTPSIIRAQKQFAAVIYSGDNTEYRKIPLDFKADLVWFKQRNGTASHDLSDSVTGITKHLTPNENSAQTTPGYPYVSSVQDDGIILRGGASSGGNVSGRNMVAWCWKAGGSTTVTNNEGSVTSQVSVNNEAGFSIVTWTGNSNSSTTIGHGLNQKPDIIILKNTSGVENWRVYYILADGSYDFTYLNTTGTKNDSGYALPTATVFNKADTNGANMVAYVWRSVPGYSKMGSYKGNGNTDGTYVPCGFRPAFVLTKINDTMNENWTISDSTRSPSNPVDLFLRSDETTTDSTGAAKMDFLSKGFKLRNTDDKTNKNNATYIFMAFAEQTGISPYHTDTNAR